jgi:hypothetical protein
MKKNNFFVSITMALIALALIAGIPMSSYADEIDTDEVLKPERRGHMMQMTAEEKAEWESSREERRAEREERREAVSAAIANNDYNAWVKAVGEDSKMLEKINEDNFDRLIKMHEYRNQAKVIAEELGIEREGQGQRHNRMNTPVKKQSDQ